MRLRYLVPTAMFCGVLLSDHCLYIRYTFKVHRIWHKYSRSQFYKQLSTHCPHSRGEPAHSDSAPWWSSGHVALPPALDEQCGAGWFQASCSATGGLWKWWGRWGCTRAGDHDGQQPALAPWRRLGLPESNNHGAKQPHVHDCKGETADGPSVLGSMWAGFDVRWVIDHEIILF